MKLSDLHRLAAQLSQLNQPDADQARDILLRLGFDPSNLYQELEMESRFADMHRDSSSTNGQMQLHSHTFYEILCCRNTCGAQYLMGAQRYRLQKGDILIVPPGVSHRPLLPERMDEPYQRYVLWISAEFMEDTLSHLIDGSVFSRCCLLRSEGSESDSIREHFRAGCQESENRASGWESAVIGNAVIILALLQRMLLRQGPCTDTESPDLLDRVLGYIETHLSQRITLEDTARRFWVSQSTITQTFRERMGVSFYHCVTQRRLIAAKSLIERGTNLEEVSHQVGFADYSTFYRAFRKEYGISPRQYRKLQAAEY